VTTGRNGEIFDRKVRHEDSGSTHDVSHVASNSSARHRPAPQARCTSTPHLEHRGEFLVASWTDTSSPTPSLASSAIVRRATRREKKRDVLGIRFGRPEHVHRHAGGQLLGERSSMSS